MDDRWNLQTPHLNSALGLSAEKTQFSFDLEDGDTSETTDNDNDNDDNNTKVEQPKEMPRRKSTVKFKNDGVGIKLSRTTRATTKSVLRVWHNAENIFTLADKLETLNSGYLNAFKCIAITDDNITASEVCKKMANRLLIQDVSCFRLYSITTESNLNVSKQLLQATDCPIIMKRVHKAETSEDLNQSLRFAFLYTPRFIEALKSKEEQLEDTELQKIADKFSDPLTGVAVADRKKKFKAYPCCFIGKEAVDWLIANNVAANRKQAVIIGNQLLHCGIFHHVNDAVGFQDKSYFYRFQTDEAALGDALLEAESNNPRSEAVIDLINSEKLHIQILRDFLKQYINPIKKQKLTQLTVLQMCFRLLTMLLPLHNTLFQSLVKLYKKYSSRNGVALPIGALFVEHYALFSATMAYLRVIERSISLLRTELSHNVALNQFCSKHGGDLDFIRGLRLPIKRIFYYHSCIKKLEKMTDASSKEGKHILATAKQLRSLVQYYDNKCKISRGEPIKVDKNSNADLPAFMIAEFRTKKYKMGTKIQHDLILRDMLCPCNGIILRNYRRKKKKYYNIFSGRDAVEWVKEHVTKNHKEAAAITSQLCKIGKWKKIEFTETKANLIELEEFDMSPCALYLLEPNPVLNTSISFNGKPRHPCVIVIDLLNRLSSLYNDFLPLIKWFGFKALVVLNTHPNYLDFNRRVSELQAANLFKLGEEEKLCFWLNTYNLLCLHGYPELKELPKSRQEQVFYFKKLSYHIGPHKYSLNEIDQIFLRNAMHLSTTSLLNFDAGAFLKKKSTDIRLPCALKKPEKFINCALGGCSKSSPPIRIYYPRTVREQLYENAKIYFTSSVKLSVVNQVSKVFLPKIVDWYYKDFAETKRDMTLALVEYLDDEDKRNQLDFILTDTIKQHKIIYEDFDWEFAPPTIIGSNAIFEETAVSARLFSRKTSYLGISRHRLTPRTSRRMNNSQRYSTIQYSMLEELSKDEKLDKQQAAAFTKMKKQRERNSFVQTRSSSCSEFTATPMEKKVKPKMRSSFSTEKQSRFASSDSLSRSLHKKKVSAKVKQSAKQQQKKKESEIKPKTEEEILLEQLALLKSQEAALIAENETQAGESAFVTKKLADINLKLQNAPINNNASDIDDDDGDDDGDEDIAGTDEVNYQQQQRMLIIQQKANKMQEKEMERQLLELQQEEKKLLEEIKRKKEKANATIQVKSSKLGSNFGNGNISESASNSDNSDDDKNCENDDTDNSDDDKNIENDDTDNIDNDDKNNDNSDNDDKNNDNSDNDDNNDNTDSNNKSSSPFAVKKEKSIANVVAEDSNNNNSSAKDKQNEIINKLNAENDNEGNSNTT